MKKTEVKNKKFHIRKGDKVRIIAGDFRGKEGVVLSVLTSQNKAIVEGYNKVSKHTKPTAANPNGGIIQKEAPIHISNLMLVDPAKNEGTRVGRKADSKGKLVRYSKKTGEVIKNG